MQTESTGIGTGAVATDETDRLISADKVEGTAVYNRMAERLGTVHTVMIDKYTGQVAYAVMSFGGFLGISEGYHPLPWKVLTTIHVRADMWSILTAVGLKARQAIRQADRSYRRRIDEYYGVPPSGGI